MLHQIYQVIGEGHAAITWWQICIHAIIVFFYGALLIRIVGKRAFAEGSALDIILTVLIGSALARAVTGNAPLFGTMAGTTVLTALYYVMIQLTQQSDFVGYLFKGKSLALIRDGVKDEKAMRRAGVSHLDLDEAVRSQGLDDLDQVAQAVFERSGRISIIPRKHDE